MSYFSRFNRIYLYRFKNVMNTESLIGPINPKKHLLHNTRVDIDTETRNSLDLPILFHTYCFGWLATSMILVSLGSCRRSMVSIDNLINAINKIERQTCRGVVPNGVSLIFVYEFCNIFRITHDSCDVTGCWKCGDYPVSTFIVRLQR